MPPLAAHSQGMRSPPATRSTFSHREIPAAAASVWMARCPVGVCPARPRPARTRAGAPAAPPAMVPPLRPLSRSRWQPHPALPSATPLPALMPLLLSCAFPGVRLPQTVTPTWGLYQQGPIAGSGHRPQRFPVPALPSRLPVSGEGVCQWAALPVSQHRVPRMPLLGGQRQLRAQGLCPGTMSLPRQGRLLPYL